MKKLFLILTMLSACSDQFVSTTDSTEAPTTVVATPGVGLTPEIAHQIAIGDICAAISMTRGTSQMDAKLAELRVQSDFTPAEITSISKGEIVIGMSERAGICALGGNRMRIKDVHTVTSTGHMTKAFIFYGSPSITLYTDNNVVTKVTP